MGERRGGENGKRYEGGRRAQEKEGKGEEEERSQRLKGK